MGKKGRWEKGGGDEDWGKKLKYLREIRILFQMSRMKVM